MKVNHKGNTVNILKYYIDEDNAFDVYVYHERKEVAEDALETLTNLIEMQSCSTLDVDYIGNDGWNISTSRFLGDMDYNDVDACVYDFKTQWKSEFNNAIKKLRTM